VPHWSPNGTSIAFVESPETPDEIGTGTVEVVAVSSGRVVQMPVPSHHHNQSFVATSWAPDGRSLAILLSHGYHSRLFTIRPDGSSLHEIHVSHVRGFDDGPLIWTPEPDTDQP
jgi:Tol biopolymer transport system component